MALEIGAVVLPLALLLFSVHALGYLFSRLRQPRLMGEILAGVLLGPYVLGKLFPWVYLRLYGNHALVVLDFMYWLGLLFLMFISGSETRRLLGKENRRATAWLIMLGGSLPFFTIIAMGWLGLIPFGALGPADMRLPILLILAIAVSVTSIPVISRIFLDLGILRSRFASLVLGIAVLEDIILWAVLAVATSLAGASGQGILSHVALTVSFTLFCLAIMPKVLSWLHGAKWNFLSANSPTAYLILILLFYAAIATVFDVTLVFAAFLAGFGVVGGLGSRESRFASPLQSITSVALALPIPLYFAFVGFQLSFGAGFFAPLFIAFILGSSALNMLSKTIAAHMAGFRGKEIVNLAITFNARGGPGIVLASVAFEAGIINAAFYTTLVITAVLTSQLAGTWLRWAIKNGWPLLDEDKNLVRELRSKV